MYPIHPSSAANGSGGRPGVAARRPWLWLLAAILAALSGHPLRAQEASDPVETYRLRAGDIVRVTVFNEADLSVEQKLDPDGVLIIPLLGRVALGGINAREAEAMLEQLFIDEEYLISPQISVTITDYAAQVFYIFGEVRSPGAKTFPQGRQSLDILEAITMAGDLSQYAKRTEIIIRRPIKGENREEKIAVNLETVIRGSRQGSDALLSIYPDDIIFVPERLF